MSTKVYERMAINYCSKFAKIAFDQGYISYQNLNHAFCEQQEKLTTSHPKLLASIIFERGYMSSQKIDQVASMMQKQKREESESHLHNIETVTAWLSVFEQRQNLLRSCA